MARTAIEILTNQHSPKEIMAIAENYIKKEGFSLVDYGIGEKVYKKGTGMAQAMQFVKIEFTPQSVVILGWVQTGVGNKYIFDEMDLKGFVGSLPKNSLKGRMDELALIISNHCGSRPFPAQKVASPLRKEPANSNYAGEQPQQGFAYGYEPNVQGNKQCTRNFCAECGSKLQPGAVFCTVCGNKIQ